MWYRITGWGKVGNILLENMVRAIFSGEVMWADVTSKMRKSCSESVFRQGEVCKGNEAGNGLTCLKTRNAMRSRVMGWGGRAMGEPQSLVGLDQKFTFCSKSNRTTLGFPWASWLDVIYVHRRSLWLQWMMAHGRDWRGVEGWLEATVSSREKQWWLRIQQWQWREER